MFGGELADQRSQLVITGHHYIVRIERQSLLVIRLQALVDFDRFNNDVVSQHTTSMAQSRVSSTQIPDILRHYKIGLLRRFKIDERTPGKRYV